MPETQTVKVTTYNINELEGKAKEKALNDLSESVSNFSDYSYILDNFNTETAEKKGIKFKEIYYNSYPWYNEGGEAEIMDVKKLLKAVGVDLRSKLGREIIENGITIKYKSRGCGSGSFIVSLWGSYTEIVKAETVASDLNQLINELADDYVKQIRDEYEYDTAEPQLIECAEANDYRYLSNGRIFNPTTF